MTIEEWATQAPSGGPAEGETPEQYEAGVARLRAAHDEQMRRFACPACGELGALAPPKDRYHRCEGATP